MKRGGDILSAQGFTIVETLIVLAVTGVLFASAALLINGKQSKTDFQVGIRNLQQQFQQVINETASGYYPNTGFSCTVPVAPPLTISTLVATEPGKNTDCIFAGKVMVFTPPNSESYTVYSLAGRRQKLVGASRVDVTSPQDAWATVIDPATVTAKLPNGLEFAGATTDAVAAPAGSFGVAFTASFANFTTSNSGTSGSQQLVLHGFSGWNVASSDVTNINGESSVLPSPYPTPQSVGLCFNSGATDQSGLITINDGLEVALTIKSGKNCP